MRELQEHLNKLDPQLDVVCYSEDEKLSVESRTALPLHEPVSPRPHLA